MTLLSFGTIVNFVATCGAILARAAGPVEWRQRSIYQVLTDRFARSSDSFDYGVAKCNVEHGLFCGGSWSGIRENLDYIQGMNFDAIWISPVVKQLQQRTGVGDAYAGYWSQDLYQLEPHFGTEEDLKALVAELRSREMLVMVDVVVNHMACPGECDYNTFYPFDSADHYHTFCPMADAADAFVRQHCWLGDENVGLADLRTEDTWVRETFAEWISQLVSNYSIDGLRIDTAINVEPEFFPSFVDAAGIFATGEVMTGDERLACEWGESIGSILNYPVYYPLIRAFSGPQGDIATLVAKINSMRENCVNTTSFATFSENHDVARFASLTSDSSLAENIIVFTMMADGIPVIFQGQEQRQNGSSKWTDNRAPLWEAGFDTSAPLYKLIALLNRSRKHISTQSQDFFEHSSEVIFQDSHSFALRKGVPGSQVITILTNHGQDSGQTAVELTNHGYPPGSRVVELLTYTNLVVDDRGLLKVTLFAGKPGIIHPAAWLAVCSGPDKRTEPSHSS
ncbi:alpha-amylase [Hortaea werneckii]|nr:alpha-amylase [Hortaea werneckii]KAI7538726.1 alpha-amylase [Hortaea werneckii]